MSALTAGWNRQPGLPQADPVWRIGHRGTGRGTRGAEMLRTTAERHSVPWIADTMTTRSAALLVMGLVIVAMTVIALSSMFVPDINERVVGIVMAVLGPLALALGLMPLVLRMETLNTKADDAKTEAAGARQEASKAARVGEEALEFVTNGGLKNSVKTAIRDDRHELALREAKRRMEQQSSQAAD